MTGRGDKKVTTHPTSVAMVLEAVTQLKDKKGTSLQAIKKYIAENHKVDIDKQAPFIRKAIKNAVTKGVLVQAKGIGAAGSFKLPMQAKPENKEKTATKEKKPKAKTTGPPKAKKPTVKKPATAARKMKAAVPKKMAPAKAAAKPAVKPKVADESEKKVKRSAVAKSSC